MIKFNQINFVIQKLKPRKNKKTQYNITSKRVEGRQIWIDMNQ